MYSPLTGNGDGSAPVVNITFDFIAKAHVKASVAGVDVSFTWTGASQITFDAVVASGVPWKVYRDTPISTPLVDFTNGSVLTEQDLDLVTQQIRFRQEEGDAKLDEGVDASAASAAEAAASAADAAQVASDAALGGPFYPELYGAVGNGIADDTAALTAALAAGAGDVIRLRKTYKVTASLTVPADTIVDARGAVIISTITGSAQAFALGARAQIIGGKWTLSSGLDAPWMFEPTGPDVLLDRVHLDKTPEAGGYHLYARTAATNFTMIDSRTSGSNGFFVEASGAAFIGNRFIGRSVGGDDAIAIKGLNGFTRNIRIIGNHIENLSYGFSIGSEVGTLAANDATYSKGVGQVIFIGNTLKNASGLGYIKPGGISAYDYRDGTVENVVVSNNVLEDLTGAKFERGLVITPGRGARVRNIGGRNNIIRARSMGGSGRLVGALDVYILDYAGGTAEASVAEVDVQITYTDPYDGLAHDGTHPGYPVTNIVNISLAGAATIGTISNIILDVTGNGSAEAGLVVGTGLTAGEIKVRTLGLRNVNQTNAAGQGGVYLDSAILRGVGYWSVSPAAGTEMSGSSGFTGGITATGALTALPNMMNISMDIDGVVGRLIAYQNGVGYRAISIQGSSVKLSPGGTDQLTATATGVTIAGAAHSIGPTSGAATDLQIDLRNTSNASILKGWSGATSWGELWVSYAAMGGPILMGASRIRLAIGLISTEVAYVDANGLVSNGRLGSAHATLGIGYVTGAGGSVVQATSKSTGVTLNKAAGQITTNNAALAAAAVVSFTVTNSAVAATDTINLNLASGNATAGTYRYWVEGVAAGSFKIVIENRSAGSLSEALVFNFAVIKGVTV